MAKLALVTGGGRGIGLAIAKRLAKMGAKVIVTGRSLDKLEAVAKECDGIAMNADLSSREDTDRLVAEIQEQHGDIDWLINNAGISDAAPIKRHTDEMWDRILELNTTAAFRLSRAFIPPMIEKKYGRVVNIASTAALSGMAYTHAYCASKHAMVGFTRSMAMELAKTGITVNAVCPGWVETEMVTEALDRIVRKTGRTREQAKATLTDPVPMGEFVQPHEVAHIVAMLCSDEARPITGQTYPIDGGQVMK